MNQKIVDGDVDSYIIKHNLFCLQNDEKFKLFLFLKDPINHAITKAMQKFPCIPLEKSDFKTIAWMGFNEALKKYDESRTKKSLISFVIDCIYWKCMDYAAAHINNKHKILNYSYSMDAETNMIRKVKQDGMPIETMVIINDYFDDPAIEPEAKDIFFLYVEKHPITKISSLLGIPRSKVKRILDKTICDLSAMWIE